MTIQWADDFGRYGTGTSGRDRMKDGLPYTNWLSIPEADPDVLSTGRAIRVVTTSANNDPYTDNYISLSSPTAATVGVASRFWFVGFGSSGNRQVLCAWLTVGLSKLASVIVEATGALTLRSGAYPGVDIASTAGPVISTNSWNHIELSYNGTTGAMEVRVNAVTVLTGTSTITGTIGVVSPQLRNTIAASGPNFYMKDFVIWDSTGSTNNNFLGTVSCLRLKPSADVTTGGWTLSTGTSGTALLAKDAPNDATYLSAGIPPVTAMEYDLQDLPADTTSVKALVPVVRARKIDGGDANIQTSLLSGAGAAAGADRPITTTYTYWFDISQLNPVSGLPWTPTEVNAARAKIDRTV